MPRIERIGDATLYLGDCREIARGLTADAVISDPPYGIAFSRGSCGSKGSMPNGAPKNWAGSDRHAGIGIAGDAGLFDPTPLFRFGNVLLWGADHFRSRLPETGRFLAWDKLAGKPSWDSFCDVEFAWHSLDGAARIYSHLWKGRSPPAHASASPILP